MLLCLLDLNVAIVNLVTILFVVHLRRDKKRGFRQLLRVNVEVQIVDEVEKRVDAQPEAGRVNRRVGVEVVLVLEIGSMLGQVLDDWKVTIPRGEDDRGPSDLTPAVDEPPDGWLALLVNDVPVLRGLDAGLHNLLDGG